MACTPVRPSAWSRTVRRNKPQRATTAFAPRQARARPRGSWSTQASFTLRRREHVGHGMRPVEAGGLAPEGPTPRRTAFGILEDGVEPGGEFDDVQTKVGAVPFCPRRIVSATPVELGEHSLPVTSEALSARRSWMAATPSRAGAWSAGIVGALLAAGVVLVGGHLAHLLSSPSTRTTAAPVTHGTSGTPKNSAPVSTIGVGISTSTSIVLGAEPGLYKLASGSRQRCRSSRRQRQRRRSRRELEGLRSRAASLVTDTDDMSVVIDGQQLVATLVGADSGTGLAVVRVHDPDALTAARFVSGTAIDTARSCPCLGRPQRAPHLLGHSQRARRPAGGGQQQSAASRLFEDARSARGGW